MDDLSIGDLRLDTKHLVSAALVADSSELDRMYNGPTRVHLLTAVS